MPQCWEFKWSDIGNPNARNPNAMMGEVRVGGVVCVRRSALVKAAVSRKALLWVPFWRKTGDSCILCGSATSFRFRDQAFSCVGANGFKRAAREMSKIGEKVAAERPRGVGSRGGAEAWPCAAVRSVRRCGDTACAAASGCQLSYASI